MSASANREGLDTGAQVEASTSQDRARPTRLSVLTAFYNEAPNLPLLRERLDAVLARLDVECEIVLIDDHSTDGSAEIAKNWVKTDPRASYLRLSRNSGSHAAYSAGLAKCRGDCAVLLAADLQDPPETIPELLARWRDGYHVVWAVRQGRMGESWSTQFLARVYYELMRRLGLSDMPPTGADFLLVDRKVIDAYNAIPEKHTSFLAMILWIGFRQTSISYVKQARWAGRSKWTLDKKLKLFADSIVSFSFAPIRMISWLGLLLIAGGLLYLVVALLAAIAGHSIAGTGFSVLLVALLLGQGAILTALGVIGEYVWRTFDEARGRPRYVLEEYVVADEEALSLARPLDGGSTGRSPRALEK